MIKDEQPWPKAYPFLSFGRQGGLIQLQYLALLNKEVLFPGETKAERGRVPYPGRVSRSKATDRVLLSFRVEPYDSFTVEDLSNCSLGSNFSKVILTSEIS